MARLAYDWTDVVPLPQQDAEDSVVKINYAPEYVEMMDLFRAVVSNGEISERVLSLTTDILDVNPGGFTVWQYRRACLRGLNADLRDELNFLDKYSADNPKNYQIWQHRRACVEMLGDASREKSFTEAVFREDAKNYHAWAHRQWAIKTFGLWDGEIEYVEEVLEEDIRNNSAWNQRWFAVHQHPAGVNDAILEREFTFTTSKLQVVTKNESAWNYLRGLASFHRDQLLDRIILWIEGFLAEDAARADNYFALGLLADLSVHNVVREEQNTITSITQASELFKALVRIDAIRAKSWTRRVHQSTARLAALQSASAAPTNP